jgi:hypothetical protein
MRNDVAIEIRSIFEAFCRKRRMDRGELRSLQRHFYCEICIIAAYYEILEWLRFLGGEIATCEVEDAAATKSGRDVSVENNNEGPQSRLFIAAKT